MILIANLGVVDNAQIVIFHYSTIIRENRHHET